MPYVSAALPKQLFDDALCDAMLRAHAPSPPQFRAHLLKVGDFRDSEIQLSFAVVHRKSSDTRV